MTRHRWHNEQRQSGDGPWGTNYIVRDDGIEYEAESELSDYLNVLEDCAEAAGDLDTLTDCDVQRDGKCYSHNYARDCAVPRLIAALARLQELSGELEGDTGGVPEVSGLDGGSEK